ncbi:hypothetical protein N9R47_04380, partial [Flavobacteriaceae bacterium]|nr:hypothetical protein [Flavobacteriaceae bacterium]
MINFFTRVKALISSDFVQFVSIKYLTFFISFLNSILIAKFLGPFAFGIYSFLTLALQYFSYSTLGINYALNTIISTKKRKAGIAKMVWQNSLGIMLIISVFILVVGILLIYFKIDGLEKYSYSKYNIWIVAITITFNFNVLYANLFRVFGKLKQINFNEGIGPIIILMALIYFNNQIQVIHIIYCVLLKNILSFIVFTFSTPLSFVGKLNFRISKILIVRGLNLLIYNLSYLFIMLSSRTLVSVFYSVEDLANYSFANSLSYNLLMVAGVFSFLFYPKMINKFSSEKDSSKIYLFIEKINSFYVGGINFLAIISVLLTPVLTIYMDKYISMLNIFKILIIGQVLINSTLGYSTYLIAKGKESLLTKTGLISIIIIVAFGTVFALLDFSLEVMTLSVLIATLYYLYSIISVASKELSIKKTPIKLLLETLPLTKIIPLLIILVSAFTDSHVLLPTLAVLLYIPLNYKQLIVI